MNKLFATLMVVALTGCGTLMPKRVELFQDKVQKFPEHSAYAQELERQLIQRLHQRSNETVEAALAEQASTNVVAPAREVQRLAMAEAALVGPPLKPSKEPSVKLAGDVEKTVAKLNRDVEEFKQDNNANAGKKIEDTGLVKVPYFYWLGGILLLGAVIFFVGKILLTAAAVANPGAAIGLNVVNAASAVVSKGFSQLVKGGEDFKDWVSQEIEDHDLKQKILNAFQSAHRKVQDSDVQNTIQSITK